MIRERREADLDRLLEVVDAVSPATGHRAGRAWLASDAELSWVFDQAPVSVAPTRNVVAHLQIARPPGCAWAAELADRRAGGVLMIGRLLVRPGQHDRHIVRYLLGEAVEQIEQRGCLPVLDPVGPRLAATSQVDAIDPVLDRLGFEETTAGDTVVLVRDRA